MENFVNELKWRELYFDSTPECENQLLKEPTTIYIGIDPTADSLHIGGLIPIIIMKHLQNYGHKPIALVGGATGMIGDPSGRSSERNLLTEEEINYNVERIRNQLASYIDFSSNQKAELVNNLDWFKEFGFIEFLRTVGKQLTISYMLAKESVQKRLEGGISFTEFSYQLLQGYDFYWLFTNKNCKVQMGGSDQWGNMVTGTELIRKMSGGEVHALTWPLVTKSDGTKFGKSQEGNIWLDASKTSPYKFYQFWLNVSDEDASRFIKMYSFLEKNEIEELIVLHNSEPHLRHLQKRLAKEVTIFVHSEEAYNKAIEASEALFGKGNSDSLAQIDDKTFQSIIEGLPAFALDKDLFLQGVDVIELLATLTNIFASKGECRKLIQGGGLSINKEKITDVASLISVRHLLNDKYIFIQKGKKQYFVINIKENK